MTQESSHTADLGGSSREGLSLLREAPDCEVWRTDHTFNFCYGGGGWSGFQTFDNVREKIIRGLQQKEIYTCFGIPRISVRSL